jgi:hypothetical protein
MINFYKSEDTIYVIPTISFWYDTSYYTNKISYLSLEISWIKWTISIKIK